MNLRHLGRAQVEALWWALEKGCVWSNGTGSRSLGTYRRFTPQMLTGLERRGLLHGFQGLWRPTFEFREWAGEGVEES